MSLIEWSDLYGDLVGHVMGCIKCGTHLSVQEKIISKAFHGHFGRAYLMEKVVNTLEGPNEDRTMATGLHRVHDIFCVKCGSNVGWRYVTAYDPAQKYKEGKYVLEVTRLKFDVP